ncbi:MAG: MBL fold metallo-hydrolase [bacterium]
MTIQLSFHGAADTVTGSCHLLQAEGLKILVDCGLFQGDRQWEERNDQDFGFDPSSIDYLLLTHGHLDHCGRIPVLVRKGFKGKIICTPATYDIAKIVFMDSAHIQEEDAGQWKKIHARRGLPHKEPLYTTLDALDALQHFGTFAQYGQSIPLNGKVQVTFKDSGHILGAAFLEIVIKGFGKVIFSGDLGNRGKPIIKDPSFPDGGDVVVVEGTYADRNHKNIEASVEEFRKAVLESCRLGGNVLIPSFAIERAQDLLFFIREFYDQGRLPSCRVFLDSPMAIKITDVMRKHPECFDPETQGFFQSHEDPFDFPGLQLTRTAEASRQINSMKSHAIIIAGSGMCTGGRIKHHLKHNIWREESSIIFVGYQAEGTLGRKIVDREKEVTIFGETYRVNARVHTIGGFSSHADKEILMDWLQHNKEIRHLFLVHGERNTLASFQEEVGNKGMAKEIHIPHLNEKFLL